MSEPNNVKKVWPRTHDIAAADEIEKAANEVAAVATEAAQNVEAATIVETKLEYADAFIRAGDRILDELRAKLLKVEGDHREEVSRLEIEHRRMMRDRNAAYDKQVAALRNEIGVMSARLGFSA